MKPGLFFLYMILFNWSAQAQTDDHPIDIRNWECHDIDTNQTTYGIIRCDDISREEWMQEVHTYYQLLMDTLSEETQVILKDAQDVWLEYLDKEIDFANQMHYVDMDGTMWRVVAAGRRLNIVRTRALELKQYYDTFTFDGM